MGAATVRAVVVVAVCEPDVPVMVSVDCPIAAVLLAVRVIVVVFVVGLGAKDAVIPLGSPDTEKVTLPVNPYCGET